MPHDGFESKQASKTKLGIMGTEVRWNKPKKTPGVGDYDITRFKALGRVDATIFTCSNPMTLHSSLQSRHNSQSNLAQPNKHTRQIKSAFKDRRHTQPKPIMTQYE